MISGIISIPNNIKTRQEYFGGILFNLNTGDVVEVDRQAFAALSFLKSAGHADLAGLTGLLSRDRAGRSSRERIEEVFSTLASLGFINVAPDWDVLGNKAEILQGKRLTTKYWPPRGLLSAPETVHWAITYRCNQTCPDCYVQRGSPAPEHELNTQEAFSVIEKIAGAGVFQLAIGGGEPFLRNDLAEIVGRASEYGLAVHITTGKLEIDGKRLASLAKYFKTLQLGIRPEEILSECGQAAGKLRALITQARHHGIITGANLIMTKSGIRDFRRIIEMLTSRGLKRYTLLRYKPHANLPRWNQENPDVSDLNLLREQLERVQRQSPGIIFRLDCALSLLQRELDAPLALYSGIRGCVAFDRVMALAPNGSVYPCSQLAGCAFQAGNLLHEDFETIWRRSRVAAKYRHFRQSRSFRNGLCGKCRARLFCGGCRVFSSDTVGFDPGCPQAVNVTTEVSSRINE